MRKLAVVLVLVAGPALAEEPKLRPFCPDRPGLDTPACTVDKGYLSTEIGLGDWTLDKQADTRTDTITAGAISLRYGVGNYTELRLGWTAYGHQRERERMRGAIDRTGGIGDVTLGVKQNLRRPDGNGFSAAALPYVTLPSGRKGIGAGDWGAGLLIPLSYNLSDAWTLEATPEADAAVDKDGSGRHLAIGSAAGIQFKVSKKTSLLLEFEAIRDRDPEEHTTQALAAFSIAYQPAKDVQLDIGANAGLNHATPDVELSFGAAKRF